MRMLIVFSVMALVAHLAAGQEPAPVKTARVSLRIPEIR